MSLKTLPLLFINLGGEMVYILDQRLRAQNIPDEKAKKVLHDIVATMFHQKFVEELFKSQPLYSKKALRTVFDRLAHASIMRLNAASMDKLYDLMTMAFKYQVSLCLRSKDILLITLNHLDAIRKFIEDVPNLKHLVDHVFKLLIETYAPLSNGAFHLIRQTLLNFFQDMHIRVSIFLKDKVQNNNGRFVLTTGGLLPWGCQVPGSIRLFDESGKEAKTASFPSGGNYTIAQKEGSIEMKGDRVTNLGKNMYSISRPVETSRGRTTTTMSDIESSTPDPLARAQLDLLSHLIGNKMETKKMSFRLNLFKTDEEEEKAAVMQPIDPMVAESQVVKIDATKKKKNEELSRIMGELTVEESRSPSGGDDLLELMDSA
ncbi:hypothetical protein ACJMK2_028622 [Sinanodonta woodiana]|uniref:Protein OSCP1 n=1 Tax=Sinanodonta woodiana TaxID=1069815 RepID=A0ABD3X810_SINWO